MVMRRKRLGTLVVLLTAARSDPAQPAVMVMRIEDVREEEGAISAVTTDPTFLIGPDGGFGVYPVAKMTPSPPQFSHRPWEVTYNLSKGDELWLSVFPPRSRFGWTMANET